MMSAHEALWLDYQKLNQENPGLNIVLQFWTLGKFVHSKLLQITQLYGWEHAVDSDRQLCANCLCVVIAVT